MANSKYHALQAPLRRTVGSLQFSIAYTYSHSIDNSSDHSDSNFVDSYNLISNRASSNFDQRHILNIGYVYDLPLSKGTGFAHEVLVGWQLSGITTFQTGTPFSLGNAASFPDNAGVANRAGIRSYADLIGDPSARLDAKFVAGSRGTFNIFNHTQWASINGTLNCYPGPSNSAGDPTWIAASNFLHPSSAHRSRILQFGLKFIF